MSVSALPPLKLLTLALVLGFAAALAIGCGKDRSNLIPAGDAQVLTQQLAEVKAAVDAGDCAAAERALTTARRSALSLPSSVDKRLRGRVNDGIQALAKAVPADCVAAQTVTQEAPTVSTETTVTVPTVTEPPVTDTVPTDTGTGTTTAPTDTTTLPTDTTAPQTGGTDPTATEPVVPPDTGTGGGAAPQP
jgi:hypothetical protein